MKMKMKNKPFIFAISGVKNSGKTTLIMKLIEIFVRRGLRVATIKHDGHDFEPDVPETDSWKHRVAGAYGTAVFSSSQLLIYKRQEVSELQLMECFPEADLILLEGLKSSPYPKLEIVRAGISDRPVCHGSGIVAIASDFLCGEMNGVPVLDLNNLEKIAERILDMRENSRTLSMIVLAGGQSRRMGSDKAELNYCGKTFLETQIAKGRRLGIQDILVSGYHGTVCTGRVVKDRYPERGPLGGLEACLRRIRHRKCLVLSVDCPKVSEEELRQMIHAFKNCRENVMILQHGERQEPLIGIYGSQLAGAMEQELLAGNGSVFAFLRENGYGVYKSYGEDEQFANINLPESYQRILQKENA